MRSDAEAAADFYGTAQGAVALRLVRERLLELWPDLSGQMVLGVGFTGPYLRLWRDKADRCIAASLAQMGALPDRTDAGALWCIADEESLPVPDLSMDRILVVHGLENAENARRMLREVWRVLKDDGHLLVVTPNRLGMWAHVESTPFGQGRPYSPGQIGRLLAGSLFRVERREHALYMPPFRRRTVLRSARLFERAGRHLVPNLAGVTLTEAVKDVYAGIPLKPALRRRLVMAEAA